MYCSDRSGKRAGVAAEGTTAGLAAGVVWGSRDSFTPHTASMSLWSYLGPENAWFAVFLPALVSYVFLLQSRVHARPAFGAIERLDPRFDALIPAGANMEVLADGLLWTEGPLWFTEDDRGFIIFSDTKKNKIYKWEEGTGFFPIGKSVYLDQSGCRTDSTRCSTLNEPGSNGLTLQPGTGLLVMCQHGERRVVRREANGTLTPLASHYQGRRLNSPNDLVFSPAGDLFFTDPPYGLNQLEEDPARELNVSGLYRVPAASLAHQTIFSAQGSPDVELVYGGLKRPNGLAFTPDGSRLLVANSDRDDPLWLSIEMDKEGRPTNRSSVRKSAKPFQMNGQRTGNPDGLKLDESGNVFATGPGGVLVLAPDGAHLGTLLTGKKTANLAFGKDGYLYICANDTLGRIQVSVKGAGLA